MSSLFQVWKSVVLISALVAVAFIGLSAVPSPPEYEPASLMAQCPKCHTISFPVATENYTTCPKCLREFHVQSKFNPSRRDDGTSWDDEPTPR